jgi:hypothetical protein
MATRSVLLPWVVFLAGCVPALIYGERTSLSIASVNVNDDVAEPVRVHVGFRRTVGTLAPARGGNARETSDTERSAKGTVSPDYSEGKAIPGGDSVSVFSNFHLTYTPPTDGNPNLFDANDLRIKTKFASGVAAIKIADSPAAVAKFMSTSENDTTVVLAKKIVVAKCVEDMKTEGQVNAIADARSFEKNTTSFLSTRADMVASIRSASPAELDKWASAASAQGCAT